MFNIEQCRAQILTEWDFTMSPSTKERKKERKKIYEKGVFKMFREFFLTKII